MSNQSSSDYVLCVTRPFGDYAIGQYIDDPDAIEEVLNSNFRSVVRVNKPASAEEPPFIEASEAVEQTPEGAE